MTVVAPYSMVNHVWRRVIMCSTCTHYELNPVGSCICMLLWIVGCTRTSSVFFLMNRLLTAVCLHSSLNTGPDQQNIPDNIPVRGLEGSFADADTHPGAFAREEHNLNAEDPARSAIPDAPGEAADEDHAIHPPTGVQLSLRHAEDIQINGCAQAGAG